VVLTINIFITEAGDWIMGLRVRKSIQICKGVKVNLGAAGVSLSLGTKGLRHTIHTSGRRTSSIGIPGTGISYTKTHRKKKNSKRLTRTNKQQWDGNEAGTDSLKVQEYNNLINTLRGIHKKCDEYIDWQSILNGKDVLEPGGIGPKQAQVLEELRNYRPGLFEKLISGNKKAELEKAVEQAKKEDSEDYKNREMLRKLAERVLNGDIDAYLDVIGEMNPLNDLLDFGSDFKFRSDSPSAIEVEFRAKSDTVVPAYSLSLTKTGKLSKKDLTKTAYYELMQDFVCSCSIRIARDIFALLPVKTVVVHVVENRVNTETGAMEAMTVLSVLFERDIINGLSFDGIDPSDAMNNFWHNMKFVKTSGFKPVDRIENYLTDSTA